MSALPAMHNQARRAPSAYALEAAPSQRSPPPCSEPHRRRCGCCPPQTARLRPPPCCASSAWMVGQRRQQRVRGAGATRQRASGTPPCQRGSRLTNGFAALTMWSPASGKGREGWFASQRACLAQSSSCSSRQVHGCRVRWPGCPSKARLTLLRRHKVVEHVSAGLPRQRLHPGQAARVGGQRRAARARLRSQAARRVGACSCKVRPVRMGGQQGEHTCLRSQEAPWQGAQGAPYPVPLPLPPPRRRRAAPGLAAPLAACLADRDHSRKRLQVLQTAPGGTHGREGPAAGKSHGLARDTAQCVSNSTVQCGGYRDAPSRACKERRVHSTPHSLACSSRQSQ